MDERRTWITVVRHTHNLASHIMANFGRVEGRKVVWLSNNIIRIVTLFLSNTSFIPAKNRHVAHFFVPKFEAIVERRPRYTSRTQEDIAVRPKRWMATNSWTTHQMRWMTSGQNPPHAPHQYQIDHDRNRGAFFDVRTPPPPHHLAKTTYPRQTGTFPHMLARSRVPAHLQRLWEPLDVRWRSKHAWGGGGDHQITKDPWRLVFLERCGWERRDDLISTKSTLVFWPDPLLCLYCDHEKELEILMKHFSNQTCLSVLARLALGPGKSGAHAHVPVTKGGKW